MKVTKLTKTVLLAIAFVGIGLAPTARAAHATNFLDALQTDVTDRLDNVDSDTPAAEKRALSAAAHSLNKKTKTLAADLGALALAATSLQKGFSNDVTFATEEELALDLYSTEAHAQWGAVVALAGTNQFPKSISNQLNQAQSALDQGDASSNSVPVRARAIAFALNKIRVANMQAQRLFKAPLFLDGSTVTLTGRESDNDRITITLETNHTYMIPENGDEPAETGTWSYGRTGSNTGTVTLSPLGGGTHTLNLKFSNSTGGTFNGETAGGENVHGRFSIED